MKKSFYLSSLLVACFSFGSVAVKAAAPTVTTNPKNDTSCAGSHIKLFFAASGTPTSYAWQYSSNGGATWDTVHNGVGPYTGATTDTLRITTTIAMRGYLYKGYAKNADGVDSSAYATIIVDSTPVVAPIVGLSALCVGSSTNLTDAAADGVWSNLHHAYDTTIPGSGFVTGLAQGFDTISYTVTNTCGEAVATHPLRIDAPASALGITGPTTTCVGHYITLTNPNDANPFGTHAWSASNARGTITSPAGVFHAITGGMDTITYVFTNSCGSVTSTVNVLIDTVYATGVVTGPATVCAGSWVTFASTVSGGAWISSNSAVANVDGSGNVTGISHGTATISYFRTNGCGISAATAPISVDTAAGAITGGDSVGIGHTLALGNSVPGGTWSSSDVTIATIGTAGIANGLDTGVTTITYTATNTCGTTHSTLLLHVGPAPYAGVILGPDSVCKGSNIVLTNSIPGGTWSSRRDTIATINDTGLVHGVAKGLDSIIYTVSNAFGTSKAVKKIFVNATAVDSIAGPAIVALGGSYTLIGYPAGGTWTASNYTMASLIGYGFFVVINSGRDTFTYTITNTCGTASKSFPISLQSAGVNNVDNFSAAMSVYPNPVHGAFNVNLTTDTKEPVTLVIADVSGRTVKEVKMNSNEETSISFDQPAGVYTLSATTASGAKYGAKIAVAN